MSHSRSKFESTSDKDDLPICWLDSIVDSLLPLIGEGTCRFARVTKELGTESPPTPDGFVITTAAVAEFLDNDGLREKIRDELEHGRSGNGFASECERKVRSILIDALFPEQLRETISAAYRELSQISGMEEADVAVCGVALRKNPDSSDPEIPLSGFLAVRGESDLFYMCKRSMASLFSEQRIADASQDLMEMKIAITIRKMVRADRGASGTAASMDSSTGFPRAIVIKAIFGLGELGFGEQAEPDCYRVFKSLLADRDKEPILERVLGEKQVRTVYGDRFGNRVKTVNTPLHDRHLFAIPDARVLQLARWTTLIENQCGLPVELDWALDNEEDQLFLVDLHTMAPIGGPTDSGNYHQFQLTEEDPKLILEGRAIGRCIVTGSTSVAHSLAEAQKVKPGSILVAGHIDADWIPVLKKAIALITDSGDASSPEGLLCRELGLPAVVGTEDATHTLYKNEEVTLDCSDQVHGRIYRRKLDFEETAMAPRDLSQPKPRLMLNISSPHSSNRWWHLNASGIGLARIEMLLGYWVGVHPLALVHLDDLEDSTVQSLIRRRVEEYENPTDFFVDTLAMGISSMAASRFPDPVLVRFSNYESKEYAKLLGGKLLEPVEPNPKIGQRGAGRYLGDFYRPAFDLECRAIAQARQQRGLTNIVPVVACCRSGNEAAQIEKILAENGLERGADGLKVYMMAEVPANFITPDLFVPHFDGFVVGVRPAMESLLSLDARSADFLERTQESSELFKRAVHQLERATHGHERVLGLCVEYREDIALAAEAITGGIDFVSGEPEHMPEIAAAFPGSDSVGA